MSEQWYFTSAGVKTGPVSFERLIELIDAGPASDRAAFRQGTRGAWILARSVVHVLRHRLAVETVPTREPPPEPPPAPAYDELHELARLCAELMSAKSRRDADEQAAPKLTELWYCRVLSTELGPMPFDDLRALARHGGLSLEDEVRFGPEGAWLPARAVEQLVPELAPPELPQPAAKVEQPQAEPGVAATPTIPDQVAATMDQVTDFADTVLTDATELHGDESRLLQILEQSDEHTLVRLRGPRITSGEQLQQCLEELEELEDVAEALTIDLDGVRSVPGAVLKHLADLSRGGTPVGFIHACEQIRDDIEFAQLERWIRVLPPSSVVGK